MRIAFMGDVMLGRLVNEAISTQGYKYPWGNMLPELKRADLRILNLETTFTKSREMVFKVFNFKAYPDRVKTLQEGRIDVVNLANNHILDFSKEGLAETLEVLDRARILHTGAGINEAQARKPAVITRKGISVGVLGYTDNEPEWAAGPQHPGTNFVNIGEIEKIKEDVERLRSKVDLLILTIHWGPNMLEEPSKDFIDFAHRVIESGVDIIHGHSAHVFQGLERYRSKLIMYDTGDFVDDYAVDPVLRNDCSFLFLVSADKKEIKQIELIPSRIENMRVNRAQDEDANWLYQALKRRISGFDTAIRKEDDSIYIE